MLLRYLAGCARNRIEILVSSKLRHHFITSGISQDKLPHKGGNRSVS